jgi:hypothetical protein
MKIINIISYINANFGENKNLKYAINDSTNKNNFKFYIKKKNLCL